eukprot:TRINITY_DN636_c0_g2_i1.p1 TRINITY_DN636_c0_g2~~TRINITY_DN636_c0_g2_i1.p1  ORF type:complete len:108 (-),score=4.67 TRINITY_DN636_c0_g2_i1:22-345(-)
MKRVRKLSPVIILLKKNLPDSLHKTSQPGIKKKIIVAKQPHTYVASVTGSNKNITKKGKSSKTKKKQKTKKQKKNNYPYLLNNRDIFFQILCPPTFSQIIKQNSTHQ